MARCRAERRVAAVVLFLVACATGSQLATRGPDGWVLRVVNDYVEVLVVSELPDGRRHGSVYPGETRQWRLYGGAGLRQLIVRAGSRSYLSAPFEPSESFPCWELVVDRAPNLAVPTGPVPCRG
jgi:hypothetical protein